MFLQSLRFGNDFNEPTENTRITWFVRDCYVGFLIGAYRKRNGVYCEVRTLWNFKFNLRSHFPLILEVNFLVLCPIFLHESQINEWFEYQRALWGICVQGDIFWKIIIAHYFHHIMVVFQNASLKCYNKFHGKTGGYRASHFIIHAKFGSLRLINADSAGSFRQIAHENRNFISLVDLDVLENDFRREYLDRHIIRNFIYGLSIPRNLGWRLRVDMRLKSFKSLFSSWSLVRLTQLWTSCIIRTPCALKLLLSLRG